MFKRASALDWSSGTNDRAILKPDAGSQLKLLLRLAAAGPETEFDSVLQEAKKAFFLLGQSSRDGCALVAAQRTEVERLAPF